MPRGIPNNPRLTPKQEAFARIYFETGNATRAYREAYDAENMAGPAISIEGWKLVRHPKIADILGKWRAEAAARMAVTVDSISYELDLALKLSIEQEDNSGIRQAAIAKAKLHGLYKDKIELGGHVQVANTELLKKLSPEEREVVRGILRAAAARAPEPANQNGVVPDRRDEAEG